MLVQSGRSGAAGHKNGTRCPPAPRNFGGGQLNDIRERDGTCRLQRFVELVHRVARNNNVRAASTCKPFLSLREAMKIVGRVLSARDVFFFFLKVERQTPNTHGGTRRRSSFMDERLVELGGCFWAEAS